MFNDYLLTLILYSTDPKKRRNIIIVYLFLPDYKRSCITYTSHCYNYWLETRCKKCAFATFSQALVAREEKVPANTRHCESHSLVSLTCSARFNAVLENELCVKYSNLWGALNTRQAKGDGGMTSTQN